MVFLFENLTHLHMLSTAGQTPWAAVVDGWEDMVLTAENLKCIRVEGEQNSGCLKIILLHGTYPKLKKLILRNVTVIEHDFDRFLKAHEAQLEIKDNHIAVNVMVEADKGEEIAAAMNQECSTSDPVEPYFDTEDGIYRCAYCRWELVLSASHDEPTCDGCGEVCILPADFNLKNTDGYES